MTIHCFDKFNFLFFFFDKSIMVEIMGIKKSPFYRFVGSFELLRNLLSCNLLILEEDIIKIFLYL